MFVVIFFFFKQKTAYEMRISVWSSDVCSSDLHDRILRQRTLGLALLSGDEKLSFELARALEKAGQSGFDTRLVLLAQAVQDKEWDRAVEIRNGLSKENQLLFALPDRKSVV